MFPHKQGPEWLPTITNLINIYKFKIHTLHLKPSTVPPNPMAAMQWVNKTC